jgi:polysaccharide export outer membrane protein
MKGWILMAGAVLVGFARAQEPAVPELQPASARQTLVAPAEHYILRPGDTVDVLFRFTPEFNDEVVIGPDGRAALKSTGDIRLAGYTLPEVQRAILIAAKEKLVDPELVVSLKDFERPHVVVGGDVQAPQKIELRKPTTALQAILLAGGPKDNSAMGRVVVFRKVNEEFAEVHILNLDHYKDKKHSMANHDLLLQPDDAILVQHDHLTTFERYVKLANIGFYLNPFGNNGIF